MTPSRRGRFPWALSTLRMIRMLALVAVDTLAFAVPRPRGNDALVVRLDAIGDFVLWLQNGAADIVVELRRHHRRVVLLAHPAWAEMARDLRMWDEVVPVDPQRFLRELGYRLSTLVAVRRIGSATVVQPRSARLFLLEDEIVRLSGAPTRIGSDAVLANTTPALRTRGNRAYTRIVPVPLALSVHESRRSRTFAAALCSTTGDVVSPSRLGAATGASIGEPYVVVAIGAGWSGRRWPIEKFAALLTAIDRETGWLCVIVGGPDEKPLVQTLRRSTTARMDDRCGANSLSDSVRLIAGSKLVVANESGPMHIGIWCAVPVVAIVGGGHFGWFAPYPPDALRGSRAEFLNFDMPCYSCNWSCRFAVKPGDAVPCVRDVSTAQVIEAALRLSSPA